jgi:hypothetical protein
MKREKDKGIASNLRGEESPYLKPGLQQNQA